jgi:hypothetical protein
MNINDRLDRIEAKLKPETTERLVWWIRFVSPGRLDRPATTSGMESRNGPDLMARPRRCSS